MVGGEPTDLDRSERRKDVALDFAAVSIEGCRGECDLFRWQPPLREVGTKRQPTITVVASEDLLASLRASRSAAARSVPGACQVRCSRPVTGSSPW